MASTEYAGIDYSGGTKNFDRENGIHFGVISMNALTEWAWEEFETEYGDPTCPGCLATLKDHVDLAEEVLTSWTKGQCKEYLQHAARGPDGEGNAPRLRRSSRSAAIKAAWRRFAADRIEYLAERDYYCPDCDASFWSDDVYPDEPLGHVLEDEQYTATIDSYNEVFILKSPYYTYAQYCSPCAPGAGHLEHPCPNGPPTYCFDGSWFEGDKAPYPVYDVKTDVLVQAGPDDDEEDDDAEEGEVPSGADADGV